MEACNKPRNVNNDKIQLEQLRTILDRLVNIIREETRAPAPHLCLQYVANSQAYVVVGRAAGVSQNEGVISSAVDVYAALIDSEEEEFLSSAAFAKSLMRLITRVIDSGNVLIGVDTETAILEVLFTISAKIRLQPEILSVWFQTSPKAVAQDLLVDEKKSFAGKTQKNDFPLCYLLVDRVHHEGRIGDFARTGLLYIFEATGRSTDLEEWVVSSDLSTLMASGLGALYSQLSRELSLLHPDATLPAVLAMSDYSTTHPRATAESAFSERHRTHMATFLSYLAFWQDVLDHCRSPDVKQTLLDHFQILFLQQLLYPSLLQSSDTDAGSSVAVLTYLTAILESLEYPDLIGSLLTYLLAIKERTKEESPVASAPRSPTAVKRRQSLMLMTRSNDPDDAAEPTLFSLVDLVLNSVSSKNDQTAYAALKLLSTMMARQKRFAFGSLLKVQQAPAAAPARTIGALELELEKWTELAASLPGQSNVSGAYAGLADDLRFVIEAQVSYQEPTLSSSSSHVDASSGTQVIPAEDPLFQAMRMRLGAFLTNSVDVNLALTQAIIAMLSCTDIRLDRWLTLSPSLHTPSETNTSSGRHWQCHLDAEEQEGWAALQQASSRPAWSDQHAPLLYRTIQAVVIDVDAVRKNVPNLEQLLSGRQNMLQAASFDGPQSEPPSIMGSPTQASFLDVPGPQASRDDSRDSSVSPVGRGSKATNNAPSPLSRSQATSPMPGRPSDNQCDSSPAPRSIFQPPPPETPSTTDVLMQKISLPRIHGTTSESVSSEQSQERSASLNHVLTNIVVLQEFVLELIAVLQVRAAVLGEREVRYS